MEKKAANRVLGENTSQSVALARHARELSFRRGLGQDLRLKDFCRGWTDHFRGEEGTSGETLSAIRKVCNGCM